MSAVIDNLIFNDPGPIRLLEEKIGWDFRLRSPTRCDKMVLWHLLLLEEYLATHPLDIERAGINNDKRSRYLDYINFAIASSIEESFRSLASDEIIRPTISELLMTQRNIVERVANMALTAYSDFIEDYRSWAYERYHEIVQ